MYRLQEIEKKYLKTDLPEFRVGDQVEIHLKLKEGDKERIQVFSGTVIGRRGGGTRETFSVRHVVGDEGVERTFPLHSPVIARIKVVRGGKVRRAKLYYLRRLTKRAARIEERRET